MGCLLAPLDGVRRALGTLRARLTLAGIALLALAVLLNTMTLVQRAQQDTLAEERDRELMESERMAAALSSRVLELQGALAAVAEQLDERTLRDQGALERFMTDRIVLRRMFGNVNVVTADGTLRVYSERSSLRKVAANVADRGYFRDAMDNARPSISEALVSRVLGEPVIVLAQPLRGPQGSVGEITDRKSVV